jgi:two-component system, cell cycle response regulator
LRQMVHVEAFDAGPDLKPLSLTVSIGVASLEGSGDTLEHMLKRADDALYRAKREGRNRVHAKAA